MFKLEQEPWIKADMETRQKMPILTWRDEHGSVIHLVEDDNEYCLVIGHEPPPEAKIYFKYLSHWPKEILRDVAGSFPPDK